MMNFYMPNNVCNFYVWFSRAVLDQRDELYGNIAEHMELRSILEKFQVIVCRNSMYIDLCCSSFFGSTWTIVL